MTDDRGECSRETRCRVQRSNLDDAFISLSKLDALISGYARYGLPTRPELLEAYTALHAQITGWLTPEFLQWEYEQANGQIHLLPGGA